MRGLRTILALVLACVSVAFFAAPAVPSTGSRPVSWTWTASGVPTRSTTPTASRASVSISYRLYFTDVEPTFTTRTFIAPDASAARARALWSGAWKSA